MSSWLLDTSIHEKGSLIDKRVDKVIKEKVSMFKKMKLRDANLFELVGNLVDYDLKVYQTHAGGWCDLSKREICLTKDFYELNEAKRYLIAGKYDLKVDAEVMKRKIILHEMGHAIQYEAETIERERTVSAYLKGEWQTESIAYRLYTEMFGKISHIHFDAYSTLKGVLFFKDWYGDYLQDDLNGTQQ